MSRYVEPEYTIFKNKFICPEAPKVPYCAWRYYGGWEITDFFPPYKMELLSPATVETYKAAVQGGANAIYIGFGTLNARASANNATRENLKEIVDYCHLYNVKVYIALNVMVKDSELSSITEDIKFADEALVDAFIISDLALLPIIRRNSVAEVHASTQMGVYNRYGAEFLKNLGFDRVVLSREADESEIKGITDNVDIDVETFVHGALCVSFSGACLMSSMLTGNSGNRGRCNQLCRKRYAAIINGVQYGIGYYLSAKDICMFDSIDILKSLRVDSAKIEGRMKSKDYVAQVTQIYSRYINNEIDLRDTDETIDRDTIEMRTYLNNHIAVDYRTVSILFNRGNYVRGYFDGQDVIFPQHPNHIGLICGKISKVKPNNTVEIDAMNNMKIGDYLKGIRNGADMGSLIVTKDIGTDDYAYEANAFYNAKAGDLVFITKSTFKEPVRRLVIELCIRIVGGERAHVIAISENGISYEYYSDYIVEEAINQPLTVKDIENQFSKTGNNRIDVEMYFVTVITENAFLAKSQLNEIRRNVIENILDKTLENYVRPPAKSYRTPANADKIEGDFAQIEGVEKFTPFLEKRFKNIVYYPNEYDLGTCLRFYEQVKRDDNLVFINFPLFIEERYLGLVASVINMFDGVIANNLGVYQIAKKMGKLVVAGWNLNISNSKNPLIRMSNQYIASVELNSGELKKFPGCLLYAYGRLPLMNLNTCTKKLARMSCVGCKLSEQVALKDDKGYYQILTRKIRNYCQHELLNPVKTILGGKLLNGHPGFFDFSRLDPADPEKICKKYFDDPEADVSKFNHLHMSRGVE